jgi:transposase
MKTTQEQTKELTKEQREIKEKIELLLKNGVEMDEIAAELKVSKGTLYHEKGVFARFGIPLRGKKGQSGRKFKIC